MKPGSELINARFQCSECGKCCHSSEPGETVVLYEADICRISTELGMKEELFIKKFLKLYKYEYRFTDQNESTIRIVLPCIPMCPFLEGTLCRIHNNKPFQCEFMPFIEPIISDYNLYNKFKNKCEGLGRGHRVSEDEISYNLKKQIEHEIQWFNNMSNHRSRVNKWVKLLPKAQEFSRNISYTRTEYEKRLYQIIN